MAGRRAERRPSNQLGARLSTPHAKSSVRAYAPRSHVRGGRSRRALTPGQGTPSWAGTPLVLVPICSRCELSSLPGSQSGHCPPGACCGGPASRGLQRGSHADTHQAGASSSGALTDDPNARHKSRDCVRASPNSAALSSKARTCAFPAAGCASSSNQDSALAIVRRFTAAQSTEREAAGKCSPFDVALLHDACHTNITRVSQTLGRPQGVADRELTHPATQGGAVDAEALGRAALVAAAVRHSAEAQ